MGFPGAAVPDDDVTAAVFAFRDDSFEVDVLDRMILDVHREMTSLGIAGDALRYCPADEHPVDLETKVVMHSSCPMSLDDEPRSTRRRRYRRLTCRFGCALEVPLLSVLPQSRVDASDDDAVRLA